MWGDKVIKILFKNINEWTDCDYNEKYEVGYRDKHVKYLTQWIEELVDKGNWTIIAATTEYIILQEQTANKLPKMPKIIKSLIKGDVAEAPTNGEGKEPETPQ